MSNEYCGCKNYETWSVKLILGNDEDSYKSAQSIANACDGMYDAAQALKTWINDENPLAGDVTVYSQLLQGALSEVDWLEVAEAFWNEKDHQEDEEDALGSITFDTFIGLQVYLASLPDKTECDVSGHDLLTGNFTLANLFMPDGGKICVWYTGPVSGNGAENGN